MIHLLVLLITLFQTAAPAPKPVLVVFETELGAMDKTERDSVRAAIDVASSWEAHHLLRSDQGLSRPAATRAMRLALGRLVGETP